MNNFLLALITGISINLFFFLATPTYAATFPTGFQESTFVSGLNQPTAMDFAPDGRLFVTEKEGKLRVVKNGQLLPDPFVSLSVDAFSERGLLGVTFDPNFATNRYIYTYYTRSNQPIKNRVSRFTASTSNPDVVEANSEVVLLDNIPSDSGMHNSGALHFGQDGKLYITVGDGGQTSTNAQSQNSLSGKVLRINKDGTIPTDNPFAGQDGKRGEIWAYGLRNPYTFNFHPTLGTMMINDVGANIWEEINVGAKGANYGWPTCEGSCDTAGFTNPIYQQYHPLMASITGASFYTGSTFPASYKNEYFFGDYVKNFIKKLNYTNGNVVTDFGNDTPTPVDIDEGKDGALYYLSIGNGAVYKVQYGNTTTPTPTITPTPTTGNAPNPTIVLPNNGATFKAGDTITYEGNATDTEDGTLPASAYTWKIVFHHDTHTHPFIDNVTGQKSGTFTWPTTGESASNVWYRIHLTVKDSNGQTSTTYRDILPKKANVTLATNPAGLAINLDGQPKTTPNTFNGVVNFQRAINATSPQTLNGKTYEFVSWSDGGAQDHTISTPNTDTTYTATYREMTTSGNGLLGTYFDHTNFTGNTAQRIDPNIDFNFGQNSPASGIQPQYYSIRWDGEIAIPQDGTYTFYTTTDDGVRLWINNTSVIDKWVDQSATEHNGQITLQGGKRYKFRMDFYNAPLDGVAKLSWSGPGFSKQIVPKSVLFSNAETVGKGLSGVYFNNMNFTGTTTSRIDPTINFDWNTGSPISGIDPDTFSVRWTGYIIPKYTETYTFYTTTDDGLRLSINNNQIINNLVDQSATEKQGTIQLQANVKYPITLDYYENGWDAVAKLRWSSASQTKEIIPTAQLFSW